jgi:hypothetical protein
MIVQVIILQRPRIIQTKDKNRLPSLVQRHMIRNRLVVER